MLIFLSILSLFATVYSSDTVNSSHLGTFTNVKSEDIKPRLLSEYSNNRVNRILEEGTSVADYHQTPEIKNSAGTQLKNSSPDKESTPAVTQKPQIGSSKGTSEGSVSKSVNGIDAVNSGIHDKSEKTDPVNSTNGGTHSHGTESSTAAPKKDMVTNTKSTKSDTNKTETTETKNAEKSEEPQTSKTWLYAGIGIVLFLAVPSLIFVVLRKKGANTGAHDV